MPETARGRFKLFLGYAAGVGKTYRMLGEAGQMRRAGADVVIGYFEPHGRPDTIALASALGTVPRRRIEYRGAWFEEMDLEAILRLHPGVCVVDEFAHSNIPGSRHKKRWEDVLDLLAAGIDVLTNMNIQHLESLNDQVQSISDVRVRETVPDWVVQRADEVVMVDLTPRALLNRLERGVIYEPERARRAAENFFRESTLVALRELALRQAAHEVESREAPALPPASGERILIHVTADPSSAMLIRRGRRVADYLHATCYALHVAAPGQEAEHDNEAVERHLNFARNLHIDTRTLRGTDVARALVDFAQLHRITQIFIARPSQRRFALPLITRIVRRARGMQVTIVADRSGGAQRGAA
ncbi:MAG: histidine kinase [Terriglobales bacterium]